MKRQSILKRDAHVFASFAEWLFGIGMAFVVLLGLAVVVAQVLKRMAV